MICKILGLFVDILTADDKYSLLNRENLLQHFQMQLSWKQKTVFQVFLAFSKFRFNLEYFSKKITLMAHVFLNLGTRKNVI